MEIFEFVCWAAVAILVPILALAFFSLPLLPQ
jgi:hypothetical protein